MPCNWEPGVAGPAPKAPYVQKGLFRALLHDSGLLADALDGIEFSSMALAGLDRVPLAHRVLEPAPPLNQVGTVLGVAGPVLLYEPEA